MDSICEQILINIHGRKLDGYSLEELIKRTGFARQTVVNHLKHLLEADLITSQIEVRKREAWEPKKRGRLRVLYRKKKQQKPQSSEPNNKLLLLKCPRCGHQPKSSRISDLTKTGYVTETIELNFRKLKSACRFGKGGNCKENRGKCTPSGCPLALKAFKREDGN